MLATNTPVSHIRLERFGKSSIALARCMATEAGPAPDQSAYEPLFASASAVVSDYRRILQTPNHCSRGIGAGRSASHRGKVPMKGTPKRPVKTQN